MEQSKKGASAMGRKRPFAAAVGVGCEESVAMPVVCRFRFDGQTATLPFFLLKCMKSRTGRLDSGGRCKFEGR